MRRVGGDTPRPRQPFWSPRGAPCRSILTAHAAAWNPPVLEPLIRPDGGDLQPGLAPLEPPALDLDRLPAVLLQVRLLRSVRSPGHQAQGSGRRHPVEL